MQDGSTNTEANASSPRKSLTRIKALVAKLNKLVRDGSQNNYRASQLTADVEALLRVPLDSTCTDKTTRDHVISSKVSQIIQILCTNPKMTSAVLQGMTEAIRKANKKGSLRRSCVHKQKQLRLGINCAFSNDTTRQQLKQDADAEEIFSTTCMRKWSAMMASKWFVGTNTTVCQSSPCFITEFFHFVQLCGEKQKNTYGNFDDDGMAPMDDLLLPLVRGVLINETMMSINSCGRYGLTALHLASSIFLLPQVTAVLLSHGQINANVKDRKGQTALTHLVVERPLLHKDLLCTVRSLLAHPNLDVSVKDNGNKTALDHCLDHLDGSTDTVTTATALLLLIAQHPSCTSAMKQGAIKRLVYLKGPGGQNDYFMGAVVDLACNSKFDFKIVLKGGMNLTHKVASLPLPLPISRNLFAQRGVDVTRVDSNNKTAIDYCLGHLSGPPATQAIVLKLLGVISKHPSCTSSMKMVVLANLENWRVPSGLELIYVEVMTEVAGSTDYVIKTREKDGMNLAHIAALHGAPLPTARHLLDLRGLDVSVVDKDNKTALDHCLGHLEGGPDTVVRALELLRLISQHPSCTSAMIQRALEGLVDWEVPDGLQDLYTQVVTELAGNTKYDINTNIKNGMTLAHIAASNGHGDILLKVMDIAGFDPNVADDVGNTPLYYACEHLPRDQAYKVIGDLSATYDFSNKNSVDQTVLDYYRQLPGSKRNPIVMGKLEQKVGVGLVISEDQRAAQQEIPQEVRHFPVREIQLTPFTPNHPADVIVLPTTRQFVQEKVNLMAPHKIYRMEKAAKGRCCIISVPGFEVLWLTPLSGYNIDSVRLGELWSGLGFDVIKAGCRGDRCLTAQEILHAVEQFSRSLTEADHCAVLCVLSHGGEGYIYGSDGNKAYLDKLLQPLDNEHCPTMAGKPKVVVIQACAGTRNDVGVTATPAPAASAARAELNLPTVSDFFVCSPSLQGLASYVYDAPGQGSVFLDTFVDVFSQDAHKDDINTLMTWVNNKVSKTRTLVRSPAPQYYKQMSNYNSCLTKLLYFFPCPGGIQGQDWQL